MNVHQKNTKRAPISVCMIVGPGRHIECARAIASVRPYVREVVLVLTCSKDMDLERLARAQADKWEYFPQSLDKNGLFSDFGLARNRSFELATQPWRMWLDSDDIVLNSYALPDLVRGIFTTTWIALPYVVPPKNLTRERLFKDTTVKWRKRVHEYTTSDVHYETIVSDRVIVQHHPGKRQDGPDRNLRIIRLMLQENPTDLHALYELGRHGLNRCEFDIAVSAFSLWLDTPKTYASNADLQYAQRHLGMYEASVMLMLAEVAIARLQRNNAEGWYRQVGNSFPGIPNSYRGLAWLSYTNELWTAAKHNAEISLMKKEELFLQALLRNTEVGPNSDRMMYHIIKVSEERLRHA